MATKKHFTATKQFEYSYFLDGNPDNKAAGNRVTVAPDEGGKFTIPETWVVDEAENRQLQMQDKKSAATAGTKYEQWRTAFVETSPVYGLDSRGKQTAEPIGQKVRRIILPVK